VTSLSREDVAHVATLARLALSDEELERYTDQLQAVLDHARDLETFDLASIAPTAHPFAVGAYLREDVVVASLDRDEVLSQAPAVEDDRFCVPQIIGDAP
jgi:aspartyl-tRNA(Asn)/glutamyl-tRNA(Gln) amidotransferase subunit C